MEGKDRKLSPQTQAVHEGHSALAHRGAVKPPLYGSSTYVLKTPNKARPFSSSTMGAVPTRPATFTAVWTTPI